MNWTSGKKELSKTAERRSRRVIIARLALAFNLSALCATGGDSEQRTPRSPTNQGTGPLASAAEAKGESERKTALGFPLRGCRAQPASPLRGDVSRLASYARRSKHPLLPSTPRFGTSSVEMRGFRPCTPVREKPGAVSPLLSLFAPDRCAGYAFVPYMVGRADCRWRCERLSYRRSSK
jgi:hypothetical protein